MPLRRPGAGVMATAGKPEILVLVNPGLSPRPPLFVELHTQAPDRVRVLSRGSGSTFDAAFATREAALLGCYASWLEGK